MYVVCACFDDSHKYAGFKYTQNFMIYDVVISAGDG